MVSGIEVVDKIAKVKTSPNDRPLNPVVIESIEIIDAMIELKKTDIIEYGVKLSQFKTQLAQQKSSNVQNNNKPKCPTCNSTNLKRVSTTSKVVSVAMWGLLSQKAKKTWHCNSCGYEW